MLGWGVGGQKVTCDLKPDQSTADRRIPKRHNGGKRKHENNLELINENKIF